MSSKKVKTRSALLQAALELFAERGFNGSPTALIAKRAGVASGTLFFHFKNKEELIHELFKEVRVKIEKKALESFSEQMPMRERFLRAFSELLRYGLDNPNEFKFIEQYHFSPLSDRESSSAEEKQVFRDLLIEARDQQFIKDVPLLLLEALAFGPIVSLAKEHANCGTPIDDEIVGMTVEACWNALKR